MPAAGKGVRPRKLFSSLLLPPSGPTVLLPLAWSLPSFAAATALDFLNLRDRVYGPVLSFAFSLALVTYYCITVNIVIFI